MSAIATLAWAVFAFALGLGLLGLSVLQRYRQEDQHEQTIDRALLPQAPLPTTGTGEGRHTAWQRILHMLEVIGRSFEGVAWSKALLAPEDRLLLDQTRCNTAAGQAVFLGTRLFLALLLPVIAMLWLRPTGTLAVFEFLAALALGILLPKFALSAWAGRLRKRSEGELPLLIDLLRLLQGVGFSMDQSLQTIAERFAAVLPVLGREIHDANVAYMHGRPRAQSLRRLAESFDNENLQSLVQIVVQVHEHGGAIQEPLRQFAERLREQRKMRMKEKTGKLSVKMTVVMMLTLLPALLLVLAGPAVVSLAGTMLRLGGH